MGKRIKKLRSERNYSRVEFAKRTNISYKFLGEIETGKKGFSADTLVKMAQELNVSCDDIVFGDMERDKNENTEKLISRIKKMNEEQRKTLAIMMQAIENMDEV